MKNTLLKFSFALGLVTSLAPLAHAGQCRAAAVRVARVNSRNASILQEVEHMKTSRAYLVSYGVTFINAEGDPASVTSIIVTMMKSDCSVVSVIPRL